MCDINANKSCWVYVVSCICYHYVYLDILCHGMNINLPLEKFSEVIG